jgi:hypothetical protein
MPPIPNLYVRREGVGRLIIQLPLEYAQELLDIVEDFDPDGYAGTDERKDHVTLRDDLAAKLRAADHTGTWIS